jgi:hypothetical protein
MFFIDLANTCNEKCHEGNQQFLYKDVNLSPYIGFSKYVCTGSFFHHHTEDGGSTAQKACIHWDTCGAQDSDKKQTHCTITA